MNQWYRIESEIKPCSYDQLILQQDLRIKWGKTGSFNKQCWKTEELHAKE